MENLSDYEKWKGDIYYLIAEQLECTTSDAQGVVDAQDFVVDQAWGQGLSAEETAKRVATASAGG